MKQHAVGARALHARFIALRRIAVDEHTEVDDPPQRRARGTLLVGVARLVGEHQQRGAVGFKRPQHERGRRAQEAGSGLPYLIRKPVGKPVAYLLTHPLPC